MKKLLKIEICGSMNSARCALIALKKKKVKICLLLFIEQYMNTNRKPTLELEVDRAVKSSLNSIKA